MATGVNNPKPVPSGTAATASTTTSSATAAAAATTMSVFVPHADPTSGTWLSLGNFEELLNSDFDYWAVNKDLKNGGMNLVRILKIRIGRLKERFDEELSLVRKRNSGFEPYIQNLYHGTSESLDRICNEGLDERLSTKGGHFGRGLFFRWACFSIAVIYIDNPAFCRIHSEEKSTLNPFIVRCEVILGDFKVYPPGSSDPSLTREPVKTMDRGKNVFYDSVQGKPGDFRQYVVYEKRRALIQYVIYYTADGPLPSLPPIPSIPSKSTKKKRPKSKERKRSTSSHDSDSGRRSSMSSGDEKGSRRSGSGKSSNADNVDDDDDDDGATCCSKVPVDKWDKNEVMSQPLTDPVSEVPKVAMRPCTRRLLNSEMHSTSAANTAYGATNAGAGSAAIFFGATSAGVDTTTLPSAATSGGAGLGTLTVAGPNTDAYKKKVHENAMKQMEDLSSDKETLFSSGDGAIELVTDMLVERFQNFLGLDDQALARRYIEEFGDVDIAVNAYLDNM